MPSSLEPEHTIRLPVTTPDLRTAGSDRPTWRPNAAGLERSRRLFLLGFVAAPVLLWVVILALDLSSPYATVRSDPTTPAATGLTVLAIIVVGFVLTLGRTPRRVRFLASPPRLEVVPFLGKPDEYPVAADAYQASIELYPRGLLSHDDAELVEVVLPPWRKQHWVLERHLLDEALPRHPPGKERRGSALRQALEISEEEEEEQDEARARVPTGGSEATREGPRAPRPPS